MVKNSGDYQKNWLWYFGQTKTELQAKMNQHSARIQDLEVYHDNGISNTARGIVLNEAALKLGLSTTNAAVISLASNFISGMRRGAKGGSYTLPHSTMEWKQTRTTGGWIELPTANGASSKRYIYGAFVENAITPKSPASNPALSKVDSAIQNATSILFGDVIRKSLATWS